MSFVGVPMTQAAQAEMRAHHDLQFTPDRVLLTWLTEFGYMHEARGDERVAFRIARHERGAPQLSHELLVHEKRLRDRRDVRCARELSCRTS